MSCCVVVVVVLGDFAFDADGDAELNRVMPTFIYLYTLYRKLSFHPALSVRVLLLLISLA